MNDKSKVQGETPIADAFRGRSMLDAILYDSMLASIEQLETSAATALAELKAAREEVATIGAELRDARNNFMESVGHHQMTKKALEQSRQESVALRRDVGAKQAEIDRLMLEYCPGDMTVEQTAEWCRNQRPVPKEDERLLDAALQESPQEGK